MLIDAFVQDALDPSFGNQAHDYAPDRDDDQYKSSQQHKRP